MRIHGVLMVRDGAATLRVCLLHHLSLGCEHLHVVDNGSTDGTTRILERLAGRIPLSWTRDDGPYEQHEVTTGLIHQAARAGADWVLVFDHDEWWTSRRPLRDVLAAAGDVAALEAPLVNFVQRRDVLRSTPRALLTMDHRPARTLHPDEAEPLVEAGALSFFEYRYPAKLLLRASERVQVRRGAHSSPNLEGAIAPAEGVDILHAPLLARDVLDRKAESGERTLEATFIERENWHMRRWAQMAREGRLDEEWRALSAGDDGCLEVGGERRALVRDTRLRDTVAAHVRPRAVNTLARALGRSY